MQDSEGTRRAQCVKPIDAIFKLSPFDDLSSFSAHSDCLKIFSVRDLNVAGSQLLQALCRSQTCIQQAMMEGVCFAEKLNRNLTLHNGLAVLHVCQSQPGS
jgi:hypothetical protein